MNSNFILLSKNVWGKYQLSALTKLIKSRFQKLSDMENWSYNKRTPSAVNI